MKQKSLWHYFSFSQTHQGKVRDHNEDACFDNPEAGVWVVADGMGGHEAGEVASRIVIDCVEMAVKDLTAEQLSIDKLRTALEQANEQILRHSASHLSGKTIGATVVLLFIQDGYFHCLWAGDSRLYLKREGRLLQKSRDHSQVMDMVSEGLLLASEAESHPLANVITRAVGVHSELALDQVSGVLLSGDQFLLCSDGLNKELSDEEIASCFAADSLTNAGMAMLHTALVKGASDNVTIALVRATEEASASEVRHIIDDTIPIFDTFQR
ncbi:PP2C family protein-serine/threonine phosphatase [Corallincola spongiicola]|uniref:Serine/threonine-protein phosphatase n=1 Tax=Corallincola spongiicola TaxID=2520508 RepID=A0ABY1WU89_9GAMM|nr:protein phosphatase 2C domain-containing protein [Corallincola spongiicola]TAA48082.1 serine/threonine-protein phosphatase [Corallincola spongiicola]